MRKIMNIILSVFLFLSLFGCGSKNESIAESGTQETKEEVTEIFAPQTQEVDSFYTTVINDYGLLDMYNNDTAQEAYKRYRNFSLRYLLCAVQENENEIISPLSLYYALAMLSNAADGETRAQLENVLGMCSEDLNNFLKDHESSQSFYSAEESYYNKVNAVFFNTHHGLKLKQTYVDTIKEYYGELIGEGDFADGSQIAEQVNKIASLASRGTLNDVLSPSDFNEDSSFVLLNALASGGKWYGPFDPADTYYQEFNNRDGSVSLAEMMHQELQGAWTGEGFSGFEKMLDNSTTVVALLPDEGTDIYDFINRMDESTIFNFSRSYQNWTNEDYNDAQYGCSVDQHITRLAFPKFKYEKEYDLNEVLTKLGLKDLFDFTKADFSNMADGDAATIDLLYLEKAKQKCSIEVNEEEVIASAATVLMGGLGAGDCHVRETIYHDVVFDRPFFYCILKGDNPLFYGVVTKLGEPADQAFKIENITGKINIRKAPATDAEKVGTFQKGEILYAFETRQSEGYTWYKIGEDRWVADKDGEWITRAD